MSYAGCYWREPTRMHRLETLFASKKCQITYESVCWSTPKRVFPLSRSCYLSRANLTLISTPIVRIGKKLELVARLSRKKERKKGGNVIRSVSEYIEGDRCIKLIRTSLDKNVKLSTADVAVARGGKTRTDYRS